MHILNRSHDHGKHFFSRNLHFASAVRWLSLDDVYHSNQITKSFPLETNFQAYCQCNNTSWPQITICSIFSWLLIIIIFCDMIFFCRWLSTFSLCVFLLNTQFELFNIFLHSLKRNLSSNTGVVRNYILDESTRFWFLVLWSISRCTLTRLCDKSIPV